MMGRQVAQGALFYAFRLDDHMPADHLLRRIDALFDFGFVRDALAASYSTSGRPSIDPELMLRMLLVGYLSGIRSERRLCEEVHLNLAYRWFCRLDLADRVPDHSTFSKNRHGRFRACDLHRLLFEQVVAKCAAAGLVAGRDVAVDGSTIMADASREKKLKGTCIDRGQTDDIIVCAPKGMDIWIGNAGDFAGKPFRPELAGPLNSRATVHVIQQDSLMGRSPAAAVTLKRKF